MPAFIAFAFEDVFFRDRFIAHQQQPNCPYRVVDHSVHGPFDDQWKRRVLGRIRSSDVTVMLIGPTTHLAEGAIWEVETSLIEGIPAFGIVIRRDLRVRIPRCFRQEHLISWEWDELMPMFERANGFRRNVARGFGT